MRRLAWIAGVMVIAFAAFMLSSHESYEPGPLMAAHERLPARCGACHRPWRGVLDQQCVACHGNITDVNPHGGYDVTSPDTGLLAGKRIAVDAEDSMVCLSCHTEHHGRNVDLGATATFACTWCHKHPSITQTPAHVTEFMRRHAPAAAMFGQQFSHRRHKVLIETHVPGISGGFACDSCHSLAPTRPFKAEQMSFKWSGCAGGGCHVAPQDSFLQLPAAIGPSPAAIPYTAHILHMNGIFTHSGGHLATPCAQCHFAMAASGAPGDDPSLEVEQCFKCHAHQPPAGLSANNGAGVFAPRFEGVALAAPIRSEHRVTACGDCHPFHLHGPILANDFHTPAPEIAADAEPHWTLTIHLPPMRAIRFSPWLIGFFGAVVAALSSLLLVRTLPAPPQEPEAIAGVAPQRTPQVPLIDDTYQTSVRHLYIVGEASGTASINLAMRSGRQVIEAIAAELKRLGAPLQPDVYDVAIVGCGPAGLGATATARGAGLRYVTLEKMTPASTLRAYPRAKFVQATPIDIAEYGSFFLEGDNSREELISEWGRIIATLSLVINDREEVVDVAADGDLLVVKTASGHAFRARTVVLAIGVRGNPRHLNLPGEEPGRVQYNLIEPQEFRNKNILVVGGGNAGSEVAQALAQPALGNRVSYSFRTPVLSSVTRENAEKISALQHVNALTLYPATALKRIKPGRVELERIADKAASAAAQGSRPDGPIEIDNDVIFAMIGAELPTGFLKRLGVKLGSKGRAGLP